MNRLVSMAIRSKIHSSFVSGNGLVTVNKVTQALAHARVRTADVVETAKFANMAISQSLQSENRINNVCNISNMFEAKVQ
jgi:hypothetical protein